MKTKNYTTYVLFLFVALMLNSELYAMGSKKPTNQPSTPTPTPTPPSDKIEPTLDFGASLPPEDYLDTAAQIGPSVDDSQNSSELSGSQREIINNEQVDQCFDDDDDSHDYFANQITYYAAKMLEDVPAKVGFIGNSYGTSTNDNNYFPTSLIRHPLCLSSASSLKATMKKAPAQSTIDKLNRFAVEVNGLRQDVLNGDQTAKKELLSTWSRLFSCLGYAESLSTADTTTSKSVAEKVSPSGYRKPAGVKFYEDRAQPQASRLNIGMFQFTPNAGGNIQPCIRAWNALHQEKTSCQINQKAKESELIKILGSSLQSFNTFCGIHKLVQTFAIQVNSNKKSATHPSNLVNGKLKPYENRCVTPHFYSGWAYNHFGPFQNSTGSNLNKLFTCIEQSQ